MLSKFEIAIIASLTSLFTLVGVNLVMNGSVNPGVNSAIANTSSNRCEPGKTVPPNNHPTDAS
ncbi:MAG: hypothetical protein WBB28_06105 [Crinalium sp.]